MADNWLTYLMSGEVPASGMRETILSAKDFRRLMQRLPADPRCKSCRSPFRGVGGRLMRALGRRPSTLNPQFCDICEQYIASSVGGTEVELTMLFADVRGSTSLAERMHPGEYSQVINRFYRVVTDVLVRADALIEKLIGDEVAAMFVPGFAGPDHARRAVETAQRILRATGHGAAERPWIPVGVGVHGGTAYVGAVGSEGGRTDIVALGDAVNTAAHLASMASAGEALVSLETMRAAGEDVTVTERRSLELKGRSDTVDVSVIRVAQEP